MKTLMKKLMMVALLSLVFISGCKKKDEYGSMTVQMTDAPGDYLHVYVDVKQVDVHYSNNQGNNGWIALATNAGVYDLIALQNNVTAVLSNGVQVPAGKVNQMRLLLGNNNTVVLSADSSSHALTIPSSYNTGIKLNVDATVPANQNVTITLDYDADASVSKNGNGEYMMSPVIKVKSVQ